MKKSVYLSGLMALCFSLFTVSSKAQMPVVTTDPVSDTVCAGDTVHLVIAATGATPMTFIWESSTDGVMWDTVFNGASYSGATNDTLTVYSSTMLNGMMYRGSAFNGDGADTSMSAVLGVDTAYAGMISGTNPLCVGATAPFSSSVPGGMWSNADHSVDTITSGGVVAALSFGSDTVFYSITNVCGTSTSWSEIRVDTAATAMPIMGPSHVCVGNVITLTNANVLGTGVWSTTTSNVSVSSTGAVTGVSGGIDTVVYNFTNGCSSVSSTKEVWIDTMITAGTISGPNQVCAGSWISLSSSLSGGIWISGTTSAAVVSSTGNVTGVAQGSSIISYYMSNSCGASFASHTVNVHIPAATITGNDSVGIDSTLVLMNASLGGMWYSADTNIAKVDTMTGLVSGIDTGMTVISYTVTNACGTSTATTPMHVGPLPDPGTILGSDTICVGSTSTLSGSVAGGTWTSIYDTVSTIDMNTGVVTGVGKGKDTVTYYITTAFGRSKVTRPIYIQTSPEIVFTGPSTFALGASYSIDVDPDGGTWTSSNTSVAHFITPNIFVTVHSGTSTLTYTVSNACGTSTDTYDVTIPGAGSVGSLSGNTGSMMVYPNPTTGAITVNLEAPATEVVNVTLSNILGETVKQFDITTNKATQVSFDQPSGMYMLTAITADGARHTTRLSVTR